MPISLEELEQNYRRAYRRLSIVIGCLYGTLLLAGLATAVGNTGFAGRLLAAVQVSEPSGPVADRIHTVKND